MPSTAIPRRQLRHNRGLRPLAILRLSALALLPVACERAAPFQFEAVADEGDVRIHLLELRPVRLELELSMLDVRHGFEPAVAVGERPIVQVTADDRASVPHGAADQRAVEPVDRRLRHLVVDPEALGHRHRRIRQVRRG